MMDKVMMIDYRDENMEFCVKNSYVYFISARQKYKVPLDDVIQVYLN